VRDIIVLLHRCNACDGELTANTLEKGGNMDDLIKFEGISDAHDTHFGADPCRLVGSEGHLVRSLRLYYEPMRMPTRVFIGCIEELHEAQLEALIEGKDV
jgi:hypothetical protein